MCKRLKILLGEFLFVLFLCFVSPFEIFSASQRSDIVAVRLTRSLGVGRGVLVVRDGDAQSATKLQRLRVTQALSGTRAVFSIGELATTAVNVVSSATRGTAPWRVVVSCLSALATHALAAPCSLQLELKLNWPCDRAPPTSVNNALKIIDERQCDGSSSSGATLTSTGSTTTDGNTSTTGGTTAAPSLNFIFFLKNLSLVCF